jgi:hypothetical protein
MNGRGTDFRKEQRTRLLAAADMDRTIAAPRALDSESEDVGLTRCSDRGDFSDGPRKPGASGVLRFESTESWLPSREVSSRKSLGSAKCNASGCGKRLQVSSFNSQIVWATNNPLQH